MPRLVVEERVAVGERVEKGQVIVMLESMKTEMVLRATVDGVFETVRCAKGDMVEEGRSRWGLERTKRFRHKTIASRVDNVVSYCILILQE
jgi:3-methylcrotonyl-CoA carboxylase alpha subunit